MTQVVRQIRTAMVLPGGWHYSQMLEGKLVKVEADSFEDLMNLVFQFRMDNQIEVGNVRKDIEDYICQNFPRWCQTFHVDVQDVEDQATLQFGDSYVHSIIKWGETIETMLNNNPRVEMKPKIIADERAEACIGCPFNQHYLGKCPRCDAKARRVFTFIRENKMSRYWKKLGGCKCFNHCNHTAVFLPKEMLRMTEGVPDRCWIKKELQNG